MRNINTALVLALSSCLSIPTASRTPNTPSSGEQDAELLAKCRDYQAEVIRMLDNSQTRCDTTGISWAMAAMNMACGYNDVESTRAIGQRQTAVEEECKRRPPPNKDDEDPSATTEELYAQLECVNALLGVDQPDNDQFCLQANQFLTSAAAAEKKCSDEVVEKERTLKDQRSWLRKMVALIRKKCKILDA